MTLIAERQYEIARQWLAQQRSPQAMQALDLVLMADPRHVEALNARASLRAQASDLSGAQLDLHAAIDIDPTRAHVFFNLGLLNRMRADEPAARAAFSQALLLDPQHERARLALSDLKPTIALGVVSSKALQAQTESVLSEQTQRVMTHAPAPSHDSLVRITQADVASISVPQDRVRLEPPALTAMPLTTEPGALAQRVVSHGPGSTLSSNTGATFTADARIDIANGNGVAGLARALRLQLAQAGVTATTASNWVNFDQRATRVYYRAGFESTAIKVSKSLPIEVPLSMLQPTVLGGRDVLVVLGQDLRVHSTSFKRDPSASLVDPGLSAQLTPMLQALDGRSSL